VPVIALVGYTNAGKSTLFNYLSGADVMAKDMLFATLDPTLRQFDMPSGRTVVLSDTVGFVSNLPTELVSAFAATLEEVVEADLILHVRDIACEDTEAQAKDVETTLLKIGVPEDAPIFEVWNKIDKVADAEERAALIASASRMESAPVVISAVTGFGLEALTARIEAALASTETLLDVLVPLTEGRMTSWFYQNATILSREDTEHGTKLRITIDNAGLSRALPFKV
jgi:GTP-binding protein HflX